MKALKESLLSGEEEIITDFGELMYIRKMFETIASGTDYRKLSMVCDRFLNHFMDKRSSKQIFRRIPENKIKDGIYIIKTSPRIYEHPDMNDIEIIYLKDDVCQDVRIYSYIDNTKKGRQVGWSRYAAPISRSTFSILLTPRSSDKMYYYCGQSEVVDGLWDEMFKKACDHVGKL